MGLLDDVMVNVKSAANSVGKKTNEIVDYSKLRFTASGLNNEIRKTRLLVKKFIPAQRLVQKTPSLLNFLLEKLMN